MNISLVKIKNGKCRRETITEHNKVRASLTDTLILLLLIFPPMYLKIDVRVIIALVLIIFTRKMVINPRTLIPVAIITTYSLLVILVNDVLGQNIELGVTIRYIRAGIMSVAISNVISSRKNRLSILGSLAAVLTLHSVIILLEIAFPAIRNNLYIFSGSQRIFYPYRANGFVNSFDFAGLFTNVGIALNALLYVKTRQKAFFVNFALCVVATLFTSRLNMLICLIVMLCVYLSIRRQDHAFGRFLIIVLSIVGMVSVSLWAITTDSLAALRNTLFSKYSWMTSLYNVIRNTYSDDAFSKEIMYQYTINGGSVFRIFGTGCDPNRDPGYVQMIYGIGLIGTGIVVITHLRYIIDAYKRSVCSTNKYSSIISNCIICVVTLEIALNFKLLFLYSTGAYELICVLIELNEGFTHYNE